MIQYCDKILTFAFHTFLHFAMQSCRPLTQNWCTFKDKWYWNWNECVDYCGRLLRQNTSTPCRTIAEKFATDTASVPHPLHWHHVTSPPSGQSRHTAVLEKKKKTQPASLWHLHKQVTALETSFRRVWWGQSHQNKHLLWMEAFLWRGREGCGCWLLICSNGTRGQVSLPYAVNMRRQRVMNQA